MRFSQASILAIASLASAKDIFEWVDEFSTIAPTDTAAFTSWRNGYEDSYKSLVKSYFDDQPSQKGFATGDASRIESSLLAYADDEKTRDYSYFYNEFHPNSTIDIYATDDYSDFFTGTEDFYETGTYETGAYETGAYETDIYETASYSNDYNSTLSSHVPSSHHSNDTKTSTIEFSHSPVRFAARDVASSTGFSTIVTGSRSASSASHASSVHGSSSQVSSSHGSSSGIFIFLCSFCILPGNGWTPSPNDCWCCFGRNLCSRALDYLDTFTAGQHV
ncbi:hypothetical protein JCM33374_g4657 [Metschnikowia sp. JCM 33374]|nr:hypothetical protein JCM33374_g4657 [Metschnikowia sp. JCM 33374]